MKLITLAPHFFSFGLDVAVKSTVLLGLAVLIVALCRRSSAALRHSIWLVVMLGLLLLPVLTWALPAWRLPILPAGWGEVVTATATVKPPLALPVTDEPPQIVTLPPPFATPPSTGEPLLPSEPGMASYGPEIESPVQEPAAIPVAEVVSDIETPAPVLSQWPLAIAVLWATGAVLFALAILRGWWRGATLCWQSQVLDRPQWKAALEKQRKKLSLRRKVGLREHPQPVVPLTWGVLRPVILLPQLARQWSQSMQRIVLMHELAHIQRGDVIAQLIGRIACALHWYHPLAWYALSKLRQEREQACDDAVVQSGEKASDYAEQLVEIARLCVAPGGLSLAIAMAEGNALERRLKSLFDVTRGHGPVGNIVVAVLFVMGALIVGPLSAVDPIPQSAEATESVETPPTETSGNQTVTTVSPSILTGDAAKERLMQLRPELVANRQGIQFGVSYLANGISFLPGQRVPFELYFRNGGSDPVWLKFLLAEELLPPRLLNEQDQQVPLSTAPHRYAIAPTIIALAPGEICVIPSRGIGVGSGQPAPALEKLTPGQYRLHYDIPVTSLDASGKELWQDELHSQPLAWEVVETTPGQPFVRTTGVERTGYISPAVLDLLRPQFGEAKRGIQLGVAANSLQKSFALGEKIPLTLLYRNVGSEKLTFDTHLDFVADPPLVTNERGERMPVSFVMHWMFIGPTTITLEPGQTWAINTPGLGLGKGGSVTSLEKPVLGKHRLTYQEGIFEKLGLPASTPVWNEHLTTGPLEFDIVVNAAGTLQAVLASVAAGDLSAQPSQVPALRPDVQQPQPDTREEAFAALVRNGKIPSNRLNAMIRLVANEGATDPEFIERVLAELHRSCEAGQANRDLLAVLRDMFAIHGTARWQRELAARRPQDPSVEHSVPDLSRITDEFQQKTLQRVISLARKATRAEIDDFVLAIRNAHHQDTRAFLLDVLNNPESNAGPVDPFAIQPASKPGRWHDNLGGSWTDAKFHAAVGLAELGAVEGIDWLMAKVAPNDFGIDGSLFGAWQHVRETRGSLRENCRYSLAELFGLDPNADHHRLTEWWQAGLEEFLPNAVSLGKTVAQTEKPKPPFSTEPAEETGNAISKPQTKPPMPADIPLDKVVWWGERVEGLEPGLWLTKTEDPRNLRIPMDSLVNYHVVVRNTTDKEMEFLVRLLPLVDQDVPYLIPSSQLDPKGKITPPQPAKEFQARGATIVEVGINAAYIISLAAGESVQLPGEYGLYVGKAPDECYPQIANFVPGAHWIVQPLLVHRLSDKETAELNRPLGEIKVTKFDRDGKSRQEPVVLVGASDDSQRKLAYAKYHLEVGTLDASADRNANSTIWGEVEKGMRCGIRIINPQPSYKTGDTLEAEVLWQNTSEAVVTTSKPRPLDLYPIIEDAEGDIQLIDFGARYELLPPGHDFQPGEVRSLGSAKVTLVAQGSPGPKDNKEPGHITLEPGNYMFSASGGVGNISPQSGKVPFTVIAGGEVPHADTGAAAVPETDSSPASRPVIDQ